MLPGFGFTAGTSLPRGPPPDGAVLRLPGFRRRDRRLGTREVLLDENELVVLIVGLQEGVARIHVGREAVAEYPLPS